MAASGPPSGGLRLRPIKTKDVGLSAAPARSKEPLEEPVTPCGKMFQQQTTNCRIICILGFKQNVELQRMREILKQTLMKHKRFKSRVEGYDTSKPKWKQIAVDIDRHVQEVILSQSESTSPTALEDFASMLAMKADMDPAYPLWDAYILNVDRPDSKGHCIFRIHHSLGDGTSLMSLLLACTRQVAEPDSLPTIPGQTAGISSAPSTSTLETPAQPPKKRTSQSVFGRMLTGLKIFVNTNIHVWEFLGMVLAVRDTKTAIKAEPGTEKGPHRLLFTDKIALADVATVRRAVPDSTINDILVATIAGGLHLYLKMRGTDSLENVRIRGLGLVNVRQTPGLQELESMMSSGSAARWGNKMGYILLPLAVGPLGDPLERVRRMKAVLDHKKLSYEAAVSYFNAKLVSNTAGSKALSQLTYRAMNQTTLAISNMIGPAEEVSLGGYPMSFVVPTVAGTPQSLTIHAQTYNGSLRLVVLAATDFVPEPEKLCAAFLEAFKQMHKAAQDSEEG